MLYSISSLFGIPLTIFQTRSLVEGGTICRMYTCFHPMIILLNFAHRDPCKDFVKKSASMCYVLQYELDILLLSNLSLAKK